jgi:uncharacterized protein YbcI
MVNERTRQGIPVEEGGSMLAELSNEMVGLYKSLFGRGPTRARSNWAGPDTLLCTLENSMTPAEKSMVALGEKQRLRDTRMLFQHATENRFRAVAERLSGRTVRGFVSGIDVESDISSEIFYLAPGPSAPAEAFGRE